MKKLIKILIYICVLFNFNSLLLASSYNSFELEVKEFIAELKNRQVIGLSYNDIKEVDNKKSLLSSFDFSFIPGVSTGDSCAEVKLKRRALKLNDRQMYQKGQTLFRKKYFCKSARYFERLRIFGNSQQTKQNLETILREAESFFMAGDYIAAINAANDIIVGESSRVNKYSWLPKEFTDYLHYIVLRSSFRLFKSVYRESNFLNYFLGQKTNQVTSRRTYNMSAASYLEKKNLPQRAGEIKFLKDKAYILFVKKNIAPGLASLSRAEAVKASLLVDKKFRRSLYIQAASRFMVSFTMIETEKLSSEPELKELFDLSLSSLKKAYRGIVSMGLAELESDEIISLLYMTLDPYRGFGSLPDIKMGAKVLEQVKKEMLLAKEQARDEFLGLAPVLWDEQGEESLKKAVRLANPIRITVNRVNADKTISENKDLSYISDNFKSLSEFRQGYYFKKYQNYPNYRKCTDKERLGQSLGIRPDNGLAMNLEKCGLSENRPNYMGPEEHARYQVIYHWEDISTELLTPEQASQEIAVQLEELLSQLEDY